MFAPFPVFRPLRRSVMNTIGQRFRLQEKTGSVFDLKCPRCALGSLSGNFILYFAFVAEKAKLQKKRPHCQNSTDASYKSIQIFNKFSASR
jgi:hypothetical protein